MYLTGYWEPTPEVGDNDIGLDQIGFDPAELAQEDEPADQETEDALKAALSNAQINSTTPQVDDDSSSSDEAELLKEL